jgi:putative membrane protein
MRLFLSCVIMFFITQLFAVAQAPVKSKLSFTEKQFIEQAALSTVKEVGAANIAKKKAYDQKVKAFSEMELSDHNNANVQLMNLAKSKNIVLPKTSISKTGTASFGVTQYAKAATKTGSQQTTAPADQNPQGQMISKTGEGANNSINGAGSGSMISGSTSNIRGGISEGLNTAVAKTSNQQEVREALKTLSDFNGVAFDAAYIQMMIRDHESTISLFEAAEKLEDPQIKSFATKNLNFLRHHLKKIKDIGIPQSGTPKNKESKQ